MFSVVNFPLVWINFDFSHQEAEEGTQLLHLLNWENLLRYFLGKLNASLCSFGAFAQNNKDIILIVCTKSTSECVCERDVWWESPNNKQNHITLVRHTFDYELWIIYGLGCIFHIISWYSEEYSHWTYCRRVFICGWVEPCERKGNWIKKRAKLNETWRKYLLLSHNYSWTQKTTENDEHTEKSVVNGCHSNISPKSGKCVKQSYIWVEKEKTKEKWTECERKERASEWALASEGKFNVILDLFCLKLHSHFALLFPLVTIAARFQCRVK